MRKLTLLILMTTLALSASAGTKEVGNSTLKDVQPAGTTDKKHKHLQYDMSFVTTSGKDYICRTEEKAKVKATDLPVGTNITYEVKDNKGKVKTATGKQWKCTIVRVSNASASAN
jgi:hypothetical protein